MVQKDRMQGPTRAFTRPPHPYTRAELYRSRTTTYHGKRAAKAFAQRAPAHTKPLARDDPIFSMTWPAAPCGATGPDEERDPKCPSRRVP